MAEKNYEFRRRLSVIHMPERRNPNTLLKNDEILIDDNWKIVIEKSSSELIYKTARDLEDYFAISMQVSVKLIMVDDVAFYENCCSNCIILAVKDQLPVIGARLDVYRSYRLIVKDNNVVICGNDDRGAAQGSYYLEDLMNLREGPMLTNMDIIRKPLFQPRMVHSGWGIDEFPDVHLNAIAHSGMDAILLFVSGVDKVPGQHGGDLFPKEKEKGIYKDFNDLIRRAASYGIDVYMYSYLESNKHPDDVDAQEYYNNTYGKIFKECPGFKGVVLVGESCEFPSKDTNTSMVMRKDKAKQEVPSTKPTPGWWPCCDYPQWLDIIKKVVRNHNPEADIIFWTYNWGWAPEEARLALIRNIPKDITLLATFEMFEDYTRNGLTNRCVDYTLAFEGPGKYFASEAKLANELGLKLYTMSNTGGLTWDFGVIPYEPAPYQWMLRHDALLKVRQDWGLSGLMESHHYGWWPSFISDITKWAYWEPSPVPHEICEALACRDFSKEAMPYVIKGWKDWSDAIRYYVPTNEDQYGPFRVGPSYPLILGHGKNIPSMWYARFGNGICSVNYNPPNTTRAFSGAQIKKEIASLEIMGRKMEEGIEGLEKAISLTPEKKRHIGMDMVRLGRFMYHCIITTIHVKKWWILKNSLYIQNDAEGINNVLDEMAEIAEQEIKNAEETIPLVEADSRLGWEPSMEYMCDPRRIQWKIRQVRSVIDEELPALRSSFKVKS